MEEKKVIKLSLSTVFLILAIIVIIVMGIFIYKLNNDKNLEIQKSTELQTQVNNLNGTVNELQEKANKVVAEKENLTQNTTDNNSVPKEEKTTDTSLSIIKEININSEHSLYNFTTKEWVKQIDGPEGMYYIAIDNEKNLYIVDRFQNVVKKLDAKLEKLPIDDTNIDNYVTYANVSKEDDTLVISTGDDFVTFIVSLKDFSTKLAEIGDD